jgi:hypothetical protein
MENNKNKFSIAQLLCFMIGVSIGIFLMRVLFGMEGIIGSAIGGGLGALFGMGIFSLWVSLSRKS